MSRGSNDRQETGQVSSITASQQHCPCPARWGQGTWFCSSRHEEITCRHSSTSLEVSCLHIPLQEAGVFEGEGYQLQTAETFSSNPLILFIKPRSPLSPGKLTSISPLQVHQEETRCNFHGPGLRGQRASQAPSPAFVNLKGNISLCLYKLQERKSWGPGMSQGTPLAASVPLTPFPAQGWQQGRARPQALSSPGRKMGLRTSSKQLGYHAGHPPRLPWPCAFLLLLINGTSPVPAQLGSERETGRALLQLRSGWKIVPLLLEMSPFETSPPFCAILLEPLCSECSPSRHGSIAEEPRTLKLGWGRPGAKSLLNYTSRRRAPKEKAKPGHGKKDCVWAEG